MRYLPIFILAFCLSFVSSSYAQLGENIDDGVTSFQKDKDSWRRKEEKGPQILQTIQDSIGDAGIRNITDAEQIYCYVVDVAPASYEGYTINNTAVKSFCGSLDSDLKNVLISSLFSNGDNVSSKLEQCAIKPRIMFRFIRGVDYTDVLLSSPCYSFTFFYGGKIKTYNFSKGASIVDEMVSIFSDKETVTPFVSPALLDQMMPIGVASTDDQKNKIKKSKSSTASEPIKNWEKEEKPVKEEKSGGWNNLNI